MNEYKHFQFAFKCQCIQQVVDSGTYSRRAIFWFLVRRFHVCELICRKFGIDKS